MTPYAWIPLIVLAVISVVPLFLRLIFQGLYVPLRIRRLNTVPMNPTFETFDPGRVPEELAPVIRDIFGQLASLGFQSLGNLRRASFNEIISDNYLSVWSHPSHVDSARIIIGRLRRSARFHAPTIAFIRAYADGSRLLTSNATAPRVFPKPIDFDSVEVPGATDLARLYAFHQARSRCFAGKSMAPLPDRSQLIPAIIGEMRDESARKARLGYFQPDSANAVWRLTTSGAYLITWRAIWPWRSWIRRRQRALADLQLRELGFGGLRPFLAFRPAAVSPGPLPHEGLLDP